METKSISELFDLSGKTAVVTGGAQGIGRAIATRLSEAGAHVVIADVNDKAGAAAVTGITSAGGKASFITADLVRAAEARRIVEDTVKTHGGIDILVNNAGVYPPTPALEMTEEAWDRVLSLNLKAYFFSCQAAAKAMIDSGRGGKMVNIASLDAFRATELLSHYDASKGGVVSMSRALALEFARHNIRVNVIAPGPVMTEGGQVAGQRFAAAFGMKYEEVVAMSEAKVPIGRMGKPDDIARVALFLASDAADYMAGSVVIADGGYSLRL